jgi:hypothetical protein
MRAILAFKPGTSQNTDGVEEADRIASIIAFWKSSYLIRFSIYTGDVGNCGRRIAASEEVRI